ncbi:DUF3540 domain-containing protein [Gammaproteobacteria bacterium]|nr:DUF3540 domain-containing protein [Gammaproteobacteria bacterium]
MNKSAHTSVMREENDRIELLSAEVKGGFGREFMIQLGGVVSRATLSVSCLVQPLPGDIVLVSSGLKSCHILAILERVSGADVSISFEGSAKLIAANGDIEIYSDESVEIRGAKGIQVSSDLLSINSTNAQMHCKEASVFGGSLNTVWNEVRNVVDTLSTVAERAIQSLGSSFRVISGIDQKKCQDSVAIVERVSVQRSNDAVITARRDIKIDGERIHMG